MSYGGGGGRGRDGYSTSRFNESNFRQKEYGGEDTRDDGNRGRGGGGGYGGGYAQQPPPMGMMAGPGPMLPPPPGAYGGYGGHGPPMPAHLYGGGAGPGSDAIAAAASASGIGAGAAAGGGKATAADGKPAEKKPKKVNRMAAGQKWSDTTLDEWDKSKHFFFRLFFPPFFSSPYFFLSLSLHFCGSSKPYLHAVNICLRIVLEASASERDRY